MDSLRSSELDSPSHDQLHQSPSQADRSRHKEANGCSGKRNRVAFVPMKQYSWGNLMEDFSYLEGLHRSISDARSGRSIESTEPLSFRRNHKAVERQRFLIRKALLEGIELILMPDGLIRSKQNLTNFNHNTKSLVWTVEFLFPSFQEDVDRESNAPLATQSSGSCSHLLHQISSATNIVDLLKKTLNLKKLKLPKEQKLSLMPLVEEECKDGSGDHLIFVLQCELPLKIVGTARKNSREVYLIEGTWSLSQALRGTKILEWPRIEVWPASSWAQKISSGGICVASRVPRPPAPTFPFKRPRLASDTNEVPKATFPIAGQSTHGTSIKADANGISAESITSASTSQPNPTSLTSLLQYADSEDDSMT
ncbi:hypothetical protein O181_081281 [Austropuccinia psidii MF-1]|uniref:BCD1 alpha/beta domain-containing protein n=1 Tax=Austropuccinia psidii MF-1 TaxID=1389203 RepID=A0A9Q3FQE0_9BASI|nr:hypothetical protein [Austropuccinia psidii MF-1]